ncbi:MAG TPA: hypothetical protein DHW70_01635 [Candidatus Atribacteria bacterium]|nr:hypothetical protein [Candidatus Atribacteria bacterium]
MLNNNPLLHVQIERAIQNKVNNREWSYDEKIPSERELSKIYKVSRITIRSALDDLVRKNILYRIQGKGTFVAIPKVEHKISKLSGFTEDVKKQGFEPSTKIIRKERILATKSISEKLNVNIGENIYYIERIRYGNQEPWIFEKNYFPEKYCQNLISIDLNNKSIYTILENKYNIQLEYGKEIIQAILINPLESEYLKIPVGSAGLLMERISYDINNNIVEWSQSICNANRCKFYFELRRSRPFNDEGRRFKNNI